MAIVDLVQRTEKWFEWRKEGITASMIPVIMGLSPYQTPYQLWAELVGLKQPDDLSNNYHVQRGVEQEPEARTAIENELGMPFTPVCVEADHNPLFKASLDGLFDDLKDDKTVLEIKCPCEKIYNDILEQQSQSKNFRMYAAQVQWQLNASDAPIGYLYFYLRGKQPICVTIRRKDNFIDKAEAKALEFWDFVKTKTQPPLSENDDVIYNFENEIKDSDKWEENVSSYKTLSEQIKSIEAQRNEIKSEMKVFEKYFSEAIPEGVKSFDKDGIRATKVVRNGAVNNDDFLKNISSKFGISVEELTSIRDSSRKDDSSYFRFSVHNEQKESKEKDDSSDTGKPDTSVTKEEMDEVVKIAEKEKAEAAEIAEKEKAEPAEIRTPSSFKEQVTKIKKEQANNLKELASMNVFF